MGFAEFGEVYQIESDFTVLPCCDSGPFASSRAEQSQRDYRKPVFPPVRLRAGGEHSTTYKLVANALSQPPQAPEIVCVERGGEFHFQGQDASIVAFNN